MKSIKFVFALIALMVMYPFYLIASPFNFTAKKAVWDLDAALTHVFKAWYLRMKLPSIQFQFVVLFVVTIFTGVMLHISSPTACNIQGQCISTDFNSVPVTLK